MKLLVIRKKSLPDRVLGELYTDGKYFCKTLEDAKRDKKIMNETCIKAGTYPVIVNMSNRFKRLLPLLQNVPEFEGVRIHSGNTPADTSGCILVGEKYDNKFNLVNSSPFEKTLIERMQTDKEKHSIEIREEFDGLL